MTGTVKHAKLETRTARARLKRGRQPHLQALVPGRVALGYQRWPDESEGRWMLRRFIGNRRYRATTIGRADDAVDADGRRVLNYQQAVATARAMVDTPQGRIHKLTVRAALDLYIEAKRSQGQPVADLISRSAVHILPAIGDLLVADLTAEGLRRWLAVMAASPAQTRAKAGQPRYRAEPKSDEDQRRRRASSNRVLTMLKAALNFAYDEGHVANRDAWGRKLRPFPGVGMARVRFLSVAEAQRLINAADADFRALVIGALQTGCRYGELARLEIADLNVDAGTLTIRKSKTGRMRHVVLSEEGMAFFRQHCAGRAGNELIFLHEDGRPWSTSDQKRPMDEANERARLRPRIVFHGLRHTWASLAVMGGMPLMVVARNLGHVDCRMVERVYGHLSNSFISDQVRRHAPQFGIKSAKKIVPLR